MQTTKILIVEDEGITALDLENRLTNGGYCVSAVAASGEDAIQKTAETQPDLVLMDIRLKGPMDGVEAARQIRTRFDIPVVYLTAHADEATVKRAKTAEPYGYLLKPFDEKELHSTIEIALYKHKIERRLKESEEKHRLLVENANEAIVVAQDGMLKFHNPKAVKIIGYSPEELASTPFAEVIHPDDRQEAVEYYQRCLMGDETPLLYSIRVIDKDGGIKWLESNAVLINWEGRPATLNFLSDITERKWAEKALHRSQQLLEKTFASLRDALFLVSADTRILDFNPAAAEIFGYEHQEMLGQTTAFLHADDAALEEFQENLYSALEEKGFLFLPEFKMKRKNGTIFPTEHSVAPLKDDQGKLIGWVSAVRDISERVRAEETLRQRARELELLNLASQEFNSSLDVDRVLASVLHEVCKLLDVIGASIWLIDRETGELVCRQVADPQSDFVRGWRLAPGEGIAGWVAENGQGLIVPDLRAEERYVKEVEERGGMTLRSMLSVPLQSKDEVIGVLQVVDSEINRFWPKDMMLLEPLAASAATAIENARLFRQVRAGRQRMQSLSRRLVEVQESERRYIAGELHDEIGQILTGLLLTLDMGKRSTPEEAQVSLDEAQNMVNELIARVRELSLNLRPTMLDDLGLLPALLWHIERYTTQTNISVTFKHSGLERRFLPEIETAAYRIVQEALTNVARYAGVSEVALHLWVAEEILGLQVEDHGTGFDVGAALAVGASSGLSGMRERAVLLGGQLTIESTPGTGTRLTAELPVGETSSAGDEGE